MHFCHNNQQNPKPVISSIFHKNVSILNLGASKTLNQAHFISNNDRFQSHFFSGLNMMATISIMFNILSSNYTISTAESTSKAYLTPLGKKLASCFWLLGQQGCPNSRICAFLSRNVSLPPRHGSLHPAWAVAINVDLVTVRPS